MIPISAVYVRMKVLLNSLYEVAQKLETEIQNLNENLRSLNLAWEGSAYREYSLRLKADLDSMKETADRIKMAHGLLYEAIEGYQKAERTVSAVIGEMKK